MSAGCYRIIDGYNLIHTAGLLTHSKRSDALERSRARLLEMLDDAFTERERRATSIIFDARGGTHCRNHRLVHRGMHVWFPANRIEADDFIEQLLDEGDHTRHWRIISGDRRLLRAARIYGAQQQSSDEFLAELNERRRSANASTRRNAEKPETEADLEHWLRVFADVDGLTSDDVTVPRKMRRTAPPRRAAQPATKPQADPPPQVPRQRRTKKTVAPKSAASKPKSVAPPDPKGDGHDFAGFEQELRFWEQRIAAAIEEG